MILRIKTKDSGMSGIQVVQIRATKVERVENWRARKVRRIKNTGMKIQGSKILWFKNQESKIQNIYRGI